jgi:hypothetical protein
MNIRRGVTTNMRMKATYDAINLSLFINSKSERDKDREREREKESDKRELKERDG